MISFQKQFLFIHIPKTAGNSVQSILRHYSEDEVVRRPDQDGVERFGIRNSQYQVKKHSTLAEYKAALGDEKFPDLYKFTCVRNPWDRIISFYFTPSQGVTEWNRKAFKKLVAEMQSTADHLRLTDDDKNPFGNIDFAMRFETLEEDFAKVCQRLSIPAQALPKYNRSARADYREYYDRELQMMVGKRFAAEIEYFGYSFD